MSGNWPTTEIDQSWGHSQEMLITNHHCSPLLIQGWRFLNKLGRLNSLVEAESPSGDQWNAQSFGAQCSQLCLHDIPNRPEYGVCTQNNKGSHVTWTHQRAAMTKPQRSTLFLPMLYCMYNSFFWALPFGDIIIFTLIFWMLLLLSFIQIMHLVNVRPSPTEFVF